MIRLCIRNEQQGFAQLFVIAQEGIQLLKRALVVIPARSKNNRQFGVLGDLIRCNIDLLHVEIIAGEHGGQTGVIRLVVARQNSHLGNLVAGDIYHGRSHALLRFGGSDHITEGTIAHLAVE